MSRVESFTPTGPAVEMNAKVLVCCICHNAQSYQPMDAQDWGCPNCLRRGLIWAARQAVKPWWKRVWSWT